MPSGLEIDYEKPLNGSMAAYAQQLLICTGKDDWPSKIEEGEDGVIAKGLSELLGRGGKFSDPFHRIAVTNSSFIPVSNQVNATTSAYLLPDFQLLPHISPDTKSMEALAEDLLTRKTPEVEKASASSGIGTQELHRLQGTHRIQTHEFCEALVLICGHGGRDERCGIMGPLLRSEFRSAISNSNELTLENDRPGKPLKGLDEAPKTRGSVRVGLISHIGGHRFAGNVIIYIPPKFKGPTSHALMGKGIWYGRVEPKHIEGIVKETILKGNVISELYRGGIDQDRRMLRI
ncbi:MAG: hypothetical protein M1837_003877 [Sclerophora amabilis]|nr:MAG: hypothetical protein M1837_003877 [Sclerophora amabilis]